ncbi:ATP-binding cassette domain-containing protein [Proteiniclasticum sp. C24MP]|uniref:ATP-binding cassette domain-containing protein n=1 Tax=Proteiniclasticum sp. C24MP TaxID=3374101 RepID=UPI0037546049
MSMLHVKEKIVNVVTSIRNPVLLEERYLEQSLTYPMALVRRNFSYEEAAGTGRQKELSISELCFRRGQEKVLDRVSMSFLPRKKYLILGNEDSGVDALLGILTKRIQSYEGTVTVKEKNLKRISRSRLSGELSLISKDIPVLEGDYYRNVVLSQNCDKETVRENLGRVGLLTKEEGDHRMERNEFTEDDRKRISVARALMNHSSILILDETAGSEKNESDYELEELILNMREMTVLSISHKLTKSLMEKYDRIFIMDKGSIVEEGSFSELLLNNDHFYKSYVSSET